MRISESSRRQGTPREADGRSTGLGAGGRSSVCPPSALEGKRWRQRSGLGIPGLPPPPSNCIIGGPIPPLSPGFRVSLDFSPEVGEFPQLPHRWAQTCPLPAVLALRPQPRCSGPVYPLRAFATPLASPAPCPYLGKWTFVRVLFSLCFLLLPGP